MPDDSRAQISALFVGDTQPGGVPSRCELRVIELDGPAWRRLPRMLLLRARLRLQAAALRRAGFRTRAFAVTPDLDRPFCICEIGTPAAAYASENLRLNSAAPGMVRRAIERVMGCDPGAGAVVLVGTRQ